MHKCSVYGLCAAGRIGFPTSESYVMNEVNVSEVGHLEVGKWPYPASAVDSSAIPSGRTNVYMDLMWSTCSPNHAPQSLGTAYSRLTVRNHPLGQSIPNFIQM